MDGLLPYGRRRLKRIGIQTLGIRPRLRWRLTREMSVRICADAIMLNVALLLALTIRYLSLITLQPGRETPRQIFIDFSYAYVHCAWLLTGVSVGVFWATGFYGHCRAYHGRYKALVVAQAVTVSFLLFGFFSYLAGGDVLPRSVTPVAWLLSVVFLVGARLWADLWAAVIRSEQSLEVAATQRPIQRVLVIGGDGYIGSALLPRLLDKGYRVRVLSLLLYGTEPIAELMKHPHLEIVHADFRQVNRVVEAMRGVDAVIHLGAIVGDPACALDEELTIDVNLMATRMIAEVAKGSGVNRFIFASTCSVYGENQEILDERSEINPISLYARTKSACERVLMGLADEGFAPVCLRFGTIYGLSARTRFDLVVNLLAAKAAIDGEITVTGGNQWRPFLHVDDAALAVFKVLQAPLALVRNQVFNVGSDEQNYTIMAIAEMIHEMVPSAKLRTLNPDSDARNYRVSFRKIRVQLGFVPNWTLEQGLNQVLDAIRTGRITDYRDARYSNVKFLSGEGMTLLLPPEWGWAEELLKDSSNLAVAMAEAVESGALDAREEHEVGAPAGSDLLSARELIQPAGSQANEHGSAINGARRYG